MPNGEHCSHKGLNNWDENSHVPLRKRERIMQRFRSVGGLQLAMSCYLTLAEARLTASLSGADCGRGFPLGHCLKAMKMNLEGGAF
jgi:hypothetical protein